MPHMSQGTARQLSPSTGSVTNSSNSDTWLIWNGGTGSSTSASVTSNQIWTVWNNTVVTTSTATIANQTTTITGNEIWTVWNGSYVPARQAVQPRQPTEAELAARAADQARWAAQQEALRVEKAAAEARAKELLDASLDAKQKADLKANNYFELDVISKTGDRRKYRIHRKWSGNIQQVDDAGRRLKTLCIHPREATPVEDSMLAQKLMLESGMEDELLRIANHS